MADCFRTVFGDTPCEVGVEQTSDDTFVAWALEVRTASQLVPVQDKQGGIVLVRGTNVDEVLRDVRVRLTARFGVEQGVVPTSKA